MTKVSTAKICVIVPCHNEQENIGWVIEEICSVSNTMEIVAVNDGSADSTSREARKTGKATVLDLAINLGVGGAVQTGFLYCMNTQAEYAVKLDGDGQHPPELLPAMLQPLIDDQADIVIGSRFLSDNTGFKSSFARRVGIRILQGLCNLLTGRQITDPTSGFRAYNQKAINFMARHYPTFDYPEPEEIILAAKNGLRISEISTAMRERKAGVSTISSVISVYYMIKVTLAMLFIALRSSTREKAGTTDV